MITLPIARNRRVIATTATLFAVALLAVACSSPTPSAPGQSYDGVPAGDGEGVIAPGGFPSQMPPGGDPANYDFTPRPPTPDLGYPPPATPTRLLPDADGYPAPPSGETDDASAESESDGEDTDGGDDGAEDDADAGDDEGDGAEDGDDGG